MIDMLYEPFKKWSDGGAVWLFSDPHFGDEDCSFMDPDWPDPCDQVRLINKKVQKSDTFVCLGDVGDPNYIQDINAKRKILVMGNHDAYTKCKDFFDEVYKGPLFIAPKILLSHEPVDVPFALNIHGHCHDGSSFLNGVNLAANVCGYEPVNLSALIREGALSGIKDIHRIAIEYQLAHPLHKETAPEEKKEDAGEVSLNVDASQAEGLFELIRYAISSFAECMIDESDDDMRDEAFASVYGAVDVAVNVKAFMSDPGGFGGVLSLTKDQASVLSEIIEFFLFDAIRKDEEIDNINWVASICDIYKQLEPYA